MGATTTLSNNSVEAVIIGGERRGEIIYVSETSPQKWTPDDERQAEELLAQAQEAADDISAMFRQMRQDGDAHHVEMARLRKERDELFRAIEATH